MPGYIKKRSIFFFQTNPLSARSQYFKKFYFPVFSLCLAVAMSSKQESLRIQSLELTENMLYTSEETQSVFCFTLGDWGKGCKWERVFSYRNDIANSHKSLAFARNRGWSVFVRLFSTELLLYGITFWFLFYCRIHHYTSSILLHLHLFILFWISDRQKFWKKKSPYHFQWDSSPIFLGT